MRYRPFGATYGMAVSTVSLLLEDQRGRSGRDWCDLLNAAMMSGINCFELVGSGEALIDGLRQALAGVERRLVFLAWRAPALGDPVQPAVQIMRQLNVDYLDLLVLLDPSRAPQVQSLRQDRLVRQVGVCGEGEVADQALAINGVDALITPYSLTSGWKERHRLKVASERNMAVIAHDICPVSLTGDGKPSLIPKGWFRKKKTADNKGPYQFLNEANGWSAEEICLAFALFEPAVTSVRIEADDVERITRLAAVPERDLPTGVAAQIEMARFSVDGRR
jgi:diketogulonate reductase-like aldo/keto reductase